jgi:hypothetical protein
MSRTYSNLTPHGVGDNLVPSDLYRGLVEASSCIDWNFGWKSLTNPGFRYWHHEVGNGNKENTSDVTHNVRAHPVKAFSLYLDWLRTHVVGQNSKILRFYLNAHTYGTEGSPHTDTVREGELTAVLYLTETWRAEWCGETVLFNAAGDIERAVLPRANRLFVFPSDQLHAPRPLSKSFAGLRIVLVVKVEPVEILPDPVLGSAALDEPGHLSFLHRIGSNEVNHSGRTLLTHLIGTYRLLLARGADQDVCLAGLYHSVYGTSHMRCTLPVDRAGVRARIGERAERLAWLFSVVRRPLCWIVDGDYWPTTYGESIQVSAADQRDLRTMELANLDEQGVMEAERRAGIDR